ncbi:hypothetical protein, partial [Histophilus somni]|uniref:hypothetical protein n=1 Tax=Histophilus somni TaxID=731 RepID=UPI00201F3707
ESEYKLSGVKVYLQWIDKDGWVSPVFTTTSQEDGRFTFTFKDPIVDEFGVERKFQLAGNPNFLVNVWAENPDPQKYSIVKQGDQITGFHNRLQRKNESWDFTAGINRIVNGQVVLQERLLSNEWLVKPENEWSISNSPDGKWTENGVYGTVRGKVWYDAGDAYGSDARGVKHDEWDVNATGTKVVASYLNDDVVKLLDEWKKANPNAKKLDFRSAQEKIIKDYEVQHGKGSHIAETVVASVDDNGDFYIPFRGLYGISPYKKGNASDEQFGKLVEERDKNNKTLSAWTGT